MHYKNGREAKEGDSVILRGHRQNGQPATLAGTLHQLNPGCQSCNAVLVVPTVGGMSQHTATVGDCLHAEDAFAAHDQVATLAAAILKDHGGPVIDGGAVDNAIELLRRSREGAEGAKAATDEPTA